MMTTSTSKKQIIRILFSLSLLGLFIFLGVLYNLFMGGKLSRYPRPSYENVPIVLAQAPCFETICIGDKGRMSIFTTLSQNELLYNIIDNSNGPLWFSIQGGVRGGIYFQEVETTKLSSLEIVENIRLETLGAPINLVLQALGEPDELFLMFGCGHGVHIQGNLFYRKKGIIVTIQYQTSMKERQKDVYLDRETQTQMIWYFEPASYEKQFPRIHSALKSYFDLPEGFTPESLTQKVQLWPGLNVPIKPADLCPRRR